MSGEEIKNIIITHFAKKHNVSIESIDIDTDIYLINEIYMFDYYVYYPPYGEDSTYCDERRGWISVSEILEEYRDIVLNRLDI